MALTLSSLHKALGPGTPQQRVTGLLTGGVSKGDRIVTEYGQVKRKEKEKKKRGAEAAAVAEKEAAAAERLGQRRLQLGRRGQRSTRRAQITPDLFGSSAGQTKTLLG